MGNSKSATLPSSLQNLRGGLNTTFGGSKLPAKYKKKNVSFSAEALLFLHVVSLHHDALRYI